MDVPQQVFLAHSGSWPHDAELSSSWQGSTLNTSLLKCCSSLFDPQNDFFMFWHFWCRWRGEADRSGAAGGWRRTQRAGEEFPSSSLSVSHLKPWLHAVIYYETTRVHKFC